MICAQLTAEALQAPVAFARRQRHVHNKKFKLAEAVPPLCGIFAAVMLGRLSQEKAATRLRQEMSRPEEIRWRLTGNDALTEAAERFRGKDSRTFQEADQQAFNISRGSHSWSSVQSDRTTDRRAALTSDHVGEAGPSCLSQPRQALLTHWQWSSASASRRIYGIRSITLPASPRPAFLSGKWSCSVRFFLTARRAQS